MAHEQPVSDVSREEVSMTPERWLRVSTLLGEVLELPEATRHAFLARACAGDEALRDEITSLLSAAVSSSGPNGFLESPVREPWTPVSRDGDQVGKYRIRHLLGRGGMGEVYLADDPRLARRVALKLLRAAHLADRQQTAGLVREARAASIVSHPNVCVVHDVSDESFELPYIAMEYVEGESLRARLTRARESGQRVDIAEAMELMVQAAAGLAAAHAAGVLHRDVKPENLLIRPDGLLKVVDFGVAKRSPLALLNAERLESNGSSLSAHSSERTVPAMIVGTLPYMSPEQLRGQSIDARTDVWSLGTVCYEILAGKPAFSGNTHGDVIVAVLDRDPAPLPELAPHAPQRLIALVETMLRKDRELRPADMESVHASLRSIRDEQSTLLRRHTSVRPSSLQQRTVVMAAVIAVIAAAFFIRGSVRDDASLGSSNAPPGTLALDPKRVLVTAFENSTGDSEYDDFGRLAADWIAFGLQSLPVLRVVDPSTAFLTALSDSIARHADSQSVGAEGPAVRGVDNLRASSLEMARITGAGFVASGRFDAVQDSLVFFVRVTEVSTGIQQAMLRIGGPRAATPDLLARLRQQVGGALARAADERVAALVDFATPPPSLDAYRAYAEGLALFRERRYAQSIPLFLKSIERDSTFMLPRFWAMFAYGNTSLWEEHRAMLDETAAYREIMSPLDVASLESFEAQRRGDFAQQLGAVRRAAALAPGSNWTYMEGRLERMLGNPRRAMAQFLKLDPTRGWIRGWSGYWNERTAARHELGEIEQEIDDLRLARQINPEDRELRRLEINALASNGRFEEVSVKLDSMRRVVSSDRSRSVSAISSYLVAGLEMRAHGHETEARAILDTVAAWKMDSGSTAGEKLYVALALLALERYADAELAFRALLAENPANREALARLAVTFASTGRRAESLQTLARYDSILTAGPLLTNAHLLVRGVCLGLLGERSEGTELIKTSFTRGYSQRYLLHLEALLLERMRGFKPFEELIRPRH